MALAVKVALRPDGRFEVAASAATAADGLERLTGKDAVLLDLHLPDLEGRELVQKFRERAPSTPLILHSSADGTPEIDAVRDLVDAVVLKGQIDELLSALARLTMP